MILGLDLGYSPLSAGARDGVFAVSGLLVVQNSAGREIGSLSANTDFLWDKRTGLAAKTVTKQDLV